MTYTKVHADWKDLPDRTTPITAAALEQIEQGISDVSQVAPITVADATGVRATDEAALQAGINSARTTGRQLQLGFGTYAAEGLTAAAAEMLDIRGHGHYWTKIKLPTDDGLGGTGQILKTTDVIRLRIEGVGFDGNFADSKDGATQQPLVRYETTVATNGRKDFTVELYDTYWNESAGGHGHFRAQVYENATSTFSEFAWIKVDRFRSMYHGNEDGALMIRGPGKLVELNNIYCQNDGLAGFEAQGVPSYPGSNAKPVGISAEVSYNHFIRTVRMDNHQYYRTIGGTFMQMVKQALVTNVEDYENCINPSYDETPLTATFDAGTDRATVSAIPAGHGDSSIVTLTTTGVAPAGLTAGQMYFVRDTSGATFKLATTSGGTAINVTDAGTGTHSLQFMGYTYTTAIKGDDNLHTAADPSKHEYRNLRVLRSSPHTGNRAMSYEESSADTCGEVFIEDCSFDRPINLAAGMTDVRHSVRKSYFAHGTFSNINYGTTSPIGGDTGLVEDCYFKGPAPVFNVKRPITVRECRFAGGARLTFAATGVVARFVDNLFNLDDAASMVLEITPPATGVTAFVELRNNRGKPGATNKTKLRITASGDLAELTLDAVDNELDTDTAVGNALSTSLNWRARGNRTMRRAESAVATALTNSATPAVNGGYYFVTGGTTAITNFTNGVDGQVIEVSILTGHTVNNTATIVTRAGANISGPAVRRFRNASGVWYET